MIGPIDFFGAAAAMAAPTIYSIHLMLFKWEQTKSIEFVTVLKGFSIYYGLLDCNYCTVLAAVALMMTALVWPPFQF